MNWRQRIVVGSWGSNRYFSRKCMKRFASVFDVLMGVGV